MKRFFTLQYWTDEGWYVGKLKEVPGIFSQGESLQELEENIRDAYQLMLEEEEQVLPAAKVRTKDIGVEV
jgi:predicted RNase H-like HicB family nuclease